MKKIAKENLEKAFLEESKAYTEYMIFAEIAEKEGYKNLATLFRAVGYSELIHARNHFMALHEDKFGLVDGIEEGIKTETYELTELYPVLKTVAEYLGEKKAALSFDWAWSAEKNHQKIFVDAKKTAEQSKDVTVTRFYICKSCGYTAVQEKPEECPVCHKEGNFKEF